MPPFASDLRDLLIAYFLALPIGWERERAERSAGIRTFPLVAIASCAFLLCAEHIVTGQPEAQARIIEGVITGMGFIGGGAILKTGGTVRGTATAASLWATGAIGIACATHSFHIALAVTVVTVVTLRALDPLKLDPDR